MPELPEVETVVRELRPCLVGRRILGVAAGRRALRSPWSTKWNRSIYSQTIRAVRRRGKWIIVDLDRGHLLVHLGMTGQLTCGPGDRSRESHTHWIADLDDQSQLRFRDIRRFGSVAYYAEMSAVDAFLAERLGPEPFDMTASQLFAALQVTERPLKAALLDQTVIAGIGNIYADESLFVARLLPRQRGCDTSAAEASRLLRAIVGVLQSAIDRRGSTIRNYVGGSGLRGSYQHEFRVYGRGGKSCLRCRAAIQIVRLAGRSTHFCPICQQLAAKRRKLSLK
jgi:formamidopyrimidine-DNA glycosylase